MELPQVGKQCSIEFCKQNDFLIITCAHCSALFCKNHHHISSHHCPKYKDNIVEKLDDSVNSTASKNYICAHKLCNSTSIIEMICPECKKHFCVNHRHHGCFEKTDEEISDELKVWQNAKDQFLAAKSVVDTEITENSKKSKNSALAKKVQLMKLKGRATGSKEIPSNHRKYFLIYPPLKASKKESRALFISDSWTIGKSIDSIADIMGINNTNNTSNLIKLKLFNYLNGNIITDKMDALISTLLDDSHLTDGQSLILEYSKEDTVDCTLYK
ncbi:AN1-type zinc finger protein 1 [Microplitis demolitor]|uniref:AN1-type zinc finger protein 1 n=1 Tax=Microplitis demolitor TaxID=69319 RepID=UPI0004400169|nr:AN1-type zinc finger protein 1 [Microplitis demolitor]